MSVTLHSYVKAGLNVGNRKEALLVLMIVLADGGFLNLYTGLERVYKENADGAISMTYFVDQMNNPITKTRTNEIEYYQAIQTIGTVHDQSGATRKCPAKAIG
jgi:hypothetical protein